MNSASFMLDTISWYVNDEVYNVSVHQSWCKTTYKHDIMICQHIRVTEVHLSDFSFSLSTYTMRSCRIWYMYIYSPEYTPRYIDRIRPTEYFFRMFVYRPDDKSNNDKQWYIVTMVNFILNYNSICEQLNIYCLTDCSYADLCLNKSQRY